MHRRTKMHPKHLAWLTGYIPILVGSVLLSGWLTAAEVTVNDVASLRTALAQIRPQTVLKIAPGDYSGGFAVSKIADLTIEALDANHPPHFKGGNSAWHFSQCDRLLLKNLRLSGQTQNGINIDDGGQLDRPTQEVTIENVIVSDVGPRGNHDGIKGSGLRKLTIRNCSLDGWAGQGIDLVGCHEVVIEECRFVGKPGFTATSAIQLKGGTTDVVVQRCQFENAGERAVNVGGSTGKPYFRPPQSPHEASRITVRECRFEGGPCAAAFVGVDEATFEDNIILFPEKWIFRILQESRGAEFTPCRNVLVKNNRIVFLRAKVQVDVNIGPGTAPETFRFVGNRWFAEDRPAASKPKLPVVEVDGQYGVDPR